MQDVFEYMEKDPTRLAEVYSFEGIVTVDHVGFLFVLHVVGQIQHREAPFGCDELHVM